MKTTKPLQIATASVLLLLVTMLASTSFAGNATWKASPNTGNWNTATNWTTGGPPNGPSDTAMFATSNKTSLFISAQTEVNSIVFNSGASAFSIKAPGSALDFSLNISGTGVINNSSSTQNFVADYNGSSTYAGYIQFFNSATAGTNTSYTVNPAAFILFYNTSTADHASFALNGGTGALTGYTAFMYFENNSTAGNSIFTLNDSAQLYFSGDGTNPVCSAGAATFTLNPDPVNGYQAIVQFAYATAGTSTFTLNGNTLSHGAGGYVYFSTASTAGAATLIANPGANGGEGGYITFAADSTGGTSRVELFGTGTGNTTDGYLDIISHDMPGLSIGSIEGSGSVFLGANNLMVGANNKSTIFSGTITDSYGNSTGSFGSLTKVGKGKLTLSHSSGSNYDGGTVINKGTLIAKNKTGSATGSGAIQVNSGTLSGTGRIGGAVTVSNGTTAGAILQGGTGTKAGTLIFDNTLTFNPTSSYKCYLNRTTTSKAGSVSALGVTIRSNASFNFIETGTTALTAGQHFTVINNTSASPISGHFSNLPNGSTFTDNMGTTFKASYSGGTGNDLTLTVQ